MSCISVLITERRKQVRSICRNLLEPERGIRIVGEARNGIEAVSAVARFKPNIVLLDAALINGTAASLIALIRRKSPHTRVLLLTDRAPAARTLDTLSHGARGYLEKASLPAYLPRAVRVVSSGQAWVPRKMVARIIDRLVRLTSDAPPRRMARSTA